MYFFLIWNIDPTERLKSRNCISMGEKGAKTHRYIVFSLVGAW